MDGVGPPSVLQEPLRIEVQPGSTILQLVEATDIPPEFWDRLIVFLNGIAVSDWEHVYTYDGDEVNIAMVPAGGGGDGGGKGILRSIAMIAISITAMVIAGPVGLGLTGIAYSATVAGISLAGTLLVNALIPPPTFAGASGGAGTSFTSQQEESPAYRITGQSNQSRLFQTVPRLYGRHRFFPNLGSTPLVNNVGKTSEITALYDFGLGDIALSDFRIGDLPMDVLEPDYRIHQNSYCQDLALVSKSVAYDQLSYKLERNIPLTLRTKENAARATVDIYFNQGLAILDRSNNRSTHSAGFRVEYRPANGGTWRTVPAAWYRGARVNSESLVYEAQFDYSKSNRRSGTHWENESKPRDDYVRHKTRVYRDGRLIHYSKDKDEPATGESISNGGLTYRRGVMRDAYDSDGWQVQAYELLVPFPKPNNTVVVSEETLVPFTVAVKINFPHSDTWDIRVTRTTPVADPTETSTIRDESTITLLKSHRKGNVVNLRKRHTMVELNFVASDKVNNVVQNLNAVGESRLRHVTPTGWAAVDETSNNALIALDILTGEAAKFRLSDDQIDFASWYRLQQICDELITQYINGVRYVTRRYEWNGIIDTNMTMQDALNSVLAPCHAQVSIMSNGKYGVLIDEEKDTFRQMFTPANSWGFSGRRDYSRIPDALRVKFVDEDTNWSPLETIVYRDGFTESNAEVYEDLDTFGITSFPEAHRYGRYMLAQGIFRSEQFTINVDVENLAVQRGDLVAVQHDVPLFGGYTTRVLDVDPVASSVSVSDPMELVSGFYTVRLNDGTIRSGEMTGQLGNHEFVLDDVSDLEGDELIAFGLEEAVVRKYLVHSIEPGEDFSATLTLVPYVPGVYEAVTGPLPPWDPGFGTDLLSTTRVAVAITDVVQRWEVIDGFPYKVVEIFWSVTDSAGAYAGAVIDASIGGQPPEIVTVLSQGEEIGVARFRYDDLRWYDREIEFTVTPQNTIGVNGRSDSRTVSLYPYDEKPLPPRNVFADVRSEEVNLFWDRSLSNDVTRYLIRYTPDVISPKWNSSQLLARKTRDTTELSAGARTGSYLIRAQNIIGKLSDVVIVRTTVEELPNINIIETVNEYPTWPGTTTYFHRGWTSPDTQFEVLMLDGSLRYAGVAESGVRDGNVVMLDGSLLDISRNTQLTDNFLVAVADWTPGDEVTAVYVMDHLVDLGSVYECRVQNKIRAVAYDAAENPYFYADTEDDIPILGDERNDDWNAWLEYRAIDEASFISSWASLDTIETMSLGTAEFSPWRKLNVGDVTGRIFQFRVVTTAVQPSIRVVLVDGLVSVDMPDRTWRTDNVPVPVDGVTVNFNPSFRNKPVLAVTLEGVGQAVSWKAIALDHIATTIRLYDANNNPVSGQIDLAALGYGRQRSTGI